MNNSKIEQLAKSTGFKYGARIVVLYVFSVIFKSFDLSFPDHLGVMLFRSQAFSLMYVLYGLLVWEGASELFVRISQRAFNHRITYKLIVLCLSLVVYGLLASYVFGLCYAIFDILLFKNYEAWKSFTAFSYDLIFGIFIFYLLLLAYNGIVYYYKSWKESQLNAEKLMRENIQAKYDVLKSQIDPHFFFNSLSVLTNLVYKSPDLAADYITQLAKSYRYILDKKFENLVSIKTELEFLDSYTYLIQIRHQNSIEFHREISEDVQNKGRIPPAALQMLVENAVKHNRFSVNDPLHVRIWNENDDLVVSNELKKRNGLRNSFGVGLENIYKRYELNSDRPIKITETNDQFIVRLPIIYDLER